MKFNLTIDLGNAAFDTDGAFTPSRRSTAELATILRTLAIRLDAGSGAVEAGTGPNGVFDSNGNRVGEWRTTTR